MARRPDITLRTSPGKLRTAMTVVGAAMAFVAAQTAAGDVLAAEEFENLSRAVGDLLEQGRGLMEYVRKS
jgi:hypothetical protein